MKNIFESKITIAIVVYNGVKTLENTLKSISLQNYKNIEVIVIDGGSTDGTLDIIEKYRTLISYTVSEKDNGIYDAMNKALDNATGDWLLFLGSDDVFYNEKVLCSVVPKFKKKSVNIGMVAKSDDMNIEGGFPFAKYRVSFNNPCQQAIFYPRIAYSKFRYDLKYKIYGDWALNIKIFCKYPVHFFKEVVSIYCVDGISSSTRDIDFLRDREKIIIENYTIPQMLIYRLMKLRRLVNDKLSGKNVYKGILYDKL